MPFDDSSDYQFQQRESRQHLKTQILRGLLLLLVAVCVIYSAYRAGYLHAEQNIVDATITQKDIMDFVAQTASEDGADSFYVNGYEAGYEDGHNDASAELAASSEAQRAQGGMAMPWYLYLEVFLFTLLPAYALISRGSFFTANRNVVITLAAIINLILLSIYAATHFHPIHILGLIAVFVITLFVGSACFYRLLFYKRDHPDIEETAKEAVAQQEAETIMNIRKMYDIQHHKTPFTADMLGRIDPYTKKPITSESDYDDYLWRYTLDIYKNKSEPKA